jgi:hypothetical protein
MYNFRRKKHMKNKSSICVATIGSGLIIPGPGSSLPKSPDPTGCAIPNTEYGNTIEHYEKRKVRCQVGVSRK